MLHDWVRYFTNSVAERVEKRRLGRTGRQCHLGFVPLEVCERTGDRIEEKLFLVNSLRGCNYMDLFQIMEYR